MKVVIILGSDSDSYTMRPALELLNYYNVPLEKNILSAHRTADQLAAYVKEKNKESCIFLACAGMAAHLAGAIAAHTTNPIIAVPRHTDLLGIDSLLSMVQMPKGMPVGVVAIEGAYNAALLCIQILALTNNELKAKLESSRQEIIEKVLQAHEKYKNA